MINNWNLQNGYWLYGNIVLYGFGKSDMSKKDFFKWPLLKAYSKMQNIIFPNVVFTNIILLFLDAFSVKKNRKKWNIEWVDIHYWYSYLFFLNQLRKLFTWTFRLTWNNFWNMKNTGYPTELKHVHVSLPNKFRLWHVTTLHNLPHFPFFFNCLPQLWGVLQKNSLINFNELFTTAAYD